jgi:hypothetical protein
MRLHMVGSRRCTEKDVFVQLQKLQENKGGYVTPQEWQSGGAGMRLTCMKKMVNSSEGDMWRKGIRLVYAKIKQKKKRARVCVKPGVACKEYVEEMRVHDGGPPVIAPRVRIVGTHGTKPCQKFSIYIHPNNCLCLKSVSHMSHMIDSLFFFCDVHNFDIIL